MVNFCVAGCFAMNSKSVFTFFKNNHTIYNPSMADVPFYYADRPALIPGVADGILALVVPIIGYWSLSLFFHGLDISGWQWLNKYRIHEEADEAKNKELVTQSEVIQRVLIQQAFQIMLGYFNGVIVDVSIRPGSWRDEMENLSAVMVHVARTVLGNELGEKVLQGAEKVDMAYFLYWWGIPAAQFFLAM
jgi:sphinganine C4-monooxygenase